MHRPQHGGDTAPGLELPERPSQSEDEAMWAERVKEWTLLTRRDATPFNAASRPPQ